MVCIRVILGHGWVLIAGDIWCLPNDISGKPGFFGFYLEEL